VLFTTRRSREYAILPYTGSACAKGRGCCKGRALGTYGSGLPVRGREFAELPQRRWSSSNSTRARRHTVPGTGCGNIGSELQVHDQFNGIDLDSGRLLQGFSKLE